MVTAHAISIGDASRESMRNEQVSTPRLWSSRILSGLAVMFFLVDGGMKLFKPAFVVEATRQLGYPESSIIGLGATLMACTFLYAVRRTSVLGAILLTGYLGGAVASNVRVGTPLFNIVFPVVFGCMVWGALWLRDAGVRQILPTTDRSPR
jgi:hypothetical protein